MKNLIGNDWRDSSNKSVVEVLNPATNSLIDTVPNSTVDDVAEAVEIAKNSQPKWGNTPIYERGEILKKFAKIIKEEEEDLSEILSEESGKAIRESIKEIEYLQEIVIALVEKAKHLYGVSVFNSMEMSGDTSFQFSTREPLGVVGVILPKVFKLDLLAQKVISALIMGNSVLVKPSKQTPLVVTKLVYMLRQAGVYEGVVQVIHGDGKTVGQAIAMHPDVNLISFSGSTSNGIKVMECASKNLSKTNLSLGGNNAFILCKDADVDLAVEEAARGRFYNAGQLNSSNKRFLIHSSLKEEFINKLIRKIGAINIGLPTDRDTALGCLISEDAAIKVEKQVKELIDAGAKLVIGGERSGSFFEPTIISDVKIDSPVARNLEILGPVVPIIEYESLNEVVDIVNSSAYAGGTSVFTKSLKLAFKLATILESGNIIINGSTVNQMYELTNEGWKYSGLGKEGMTASLEEMSKTKAIVLNDVLN